MNYTGFADEKHYEGINLYRGDCMDLMKQTPDKYFELAIVDPPYFIDYGKEIYPGSEISTTGIKRHRFKSNHWKIPNDIYYQNLKRISQNQIIWGINYFYFSDIGSGRIIWDKKNGKSSFSKCEIAYCSLHNRTEIFRYRWNGMIQEDMKNKEIRIHPTQKPVALYKWLLKNYAKPGDKILDTHLGSASIAIACWDMGFDLTGIEIDEEYFDAAIKRFETHKAQLQIKF